MLYMVTFTINIPPMLAYIPYMDPMGNIYLYICIYLQQIPSHFPRSTLVLCPRTDAQIAQMHHVAAGKTQQPSQINSVPWCLPYQPYISILHVLYIESVPGSACCIWQYSPQSMVLSLFSHGNLQPSTVISSPVCPSSYLPYLYTRIFEYTDSPIVFNFFGDQHAPLRFAAGA